MVFPLPRTLVKILAKNLVKNLVNNPGGGPLLTGGSGYFLSGHRNPTCVTSKSESAQKSDTKQDSQVWIRKSKTQNGESDFQTCLFKPGQRVAILRPTPYSMNSLFSEFFKEFSGVILGVCETIWGLFGGHF